MLLKYFRRLLGSINPCKNDNVGKNKLRTSEIKEKRHKTFEPRVYVFQCRKAGFSESSPFFSVIQISYSTNESKIIMPISPPATNINFKIQKWVQGALEHHFFYFKILERGVSLLLFSQTFSKIFVWLNFHNNRPTYAKMKCVGCHLDFGFIRAIAHLNHRKKGELSENPAFLH